MADALALDIDPNGVAYVGSTPRGSQWLDTRQHPDWVPEIQRLKTTEELHAENIAKAKELETHFARGGTEDTP